MTETTASFKPKATLHGVLLNIEGRGVLVTGEAGTGKSECALELIVRRGHRLIADDVVEVSRTGGVLIGNCPPGLEGLLNIRDLGILHLESVGRTTAEREQCIDLIIHLEAGPNSDESNPVEHEILGVSLPRFVLGHCCTRNLSLLVETAAAKSAAARVNIESDFLRRYDSDLLHG